MSAVPAMGGAALRAVEGAGRMARYGGLLAATAMRPPLRLRQLLAQIHDAGVRSLAIVCASGLAGGAVLGLQGYVTLVRFGAESSLGAVVGLTLIRELGPVLTGLLVTGRAGSAATAEIGTMVAKEQLDGLRMISVDPVHYMAVPKALALFPRDAPAGDPLHAVRDRRWLCRWASSSSASTAGSTSRASRVPSTSATTSCSASPRRPSSAPGSGWSRPFAATPAPPHAVGVSRATTSTVVTASVGILLGDYVLTALWGGLKDGEEDGCSRRRGIGWQAAS